MLTGHTHTSGSDLFDDKISATAASTVEQILFFRPIVQFRMLTANGV